MNSVIRRIALVLFSLAVVGCTSAPVRSTASNPSLGMKKMSLEDIFVDDSEEKLADSETTDSLPFYQAESVRPYDPSGDAAGF